MEHKNSGAGYYASGDVGMPPCTSSATLSLPLFYQPPQFPTTISATCYEYPTPSFPTPTFGHAPEPALQFGQPFWTQQQPLAGVSPVVPSPDGSYHWSLPYRGDCYAQQTTRDGATNGTAYQSVEGSTCSYVPDQTSCVQMMTVPDGNPCFTNGMSSTACLVTGYPNYGFSPVLSERQTFAQCSEKVQKPRRTIHRQSFGRKRPRSYGKERSRKLGIW